MRDFHDSIYLDYAAATPLHKEVFVAMEPYFSREFYNPSASYLAAKQVRADIETARMNVAQWIGAKPAEIVFTAGATEANNIALHGVMQRHAGANVVLASTEHDAMRVPAQAYAHQFAPVLPSGLIDIAALSLMIDEKTVLISISYANNEIGTIQPLRAIAEIIAQKRDARRRSGNELPLHLHTDASQAAGYLDIHAARLGVDLMTLNGGKIYGPKQTGVLFIDAKVQLLPYIQGGSQERGIRSGTESVAGCIGFAKALELVQQSRKEEGEREQSLRDELLEKLQQQYPQLIVNGSLKKRLPNNMNISFPGKDGERLLMECDEYGLQIATGAACSANKQTRSHVLQAIGCTPRIADGSIRLTLGRHTTPDEIDRTVSILQKVVEK